MRLSNQTTEGLDRYVYEWVKVDQGKWDEAFTLNGNTPVAIDLKGNVFGQTRYAGNHMLNVLLDQKMEDDSRLKGVKVNLTSLI